MQGQVVSSVDEAEHVYVNVLNKGDAVVKAQVPCRLAEYESSCCEWPCALPLRVSRPIRDQQPITRQ